MMNQSAQGLASLGRGNDSMLMHVTPREVAGLQGLAMAHGGSLTINPQTGLPEAGFLDGIVDFALPIVGGFFGLPPWATAALMGGKSLIQGDDPLQAAMSAFGGYTGGKFGSGIKEFATPLKAFSPDAPVGDFAKSLDTKNLTGLAKSPPPIEPLKIAQTGYTGPAAPNFGAPKSLSTGIQGNIDLSKVTQGTGVQNLGSPEFLNRQQVSIPGVEEPVTLAGGVSKVFNDPVGFARQVGEGDALMGGAQLGLYAGKPFIENALTPEPYPGYIDPDKDKYRGPQGQLSLNPKYKTNLSLLPNLNAKEGGYIDGYATGGTVQSGGIRDLYGTPDNQPTISPGLGGFGLGRLNSLAGEQAMTQAQTLGYADGGLTSLKPGGYLDGMGDGMSDSIPATIEGKQPARLADGEFVIPADVVSHLGNGSSKAGSKRLYAMLDKIRHARTGNKKQGKQINPSKYMPA